MQGTDVNLKIKAESEQIRGMLGSELGKLHDSLSDQNFRLNKIDFDQQNMFDPKEQLNWQWKQQQQNSQQQLEEFKETLAMRKMHANISANKTNIVPKTSYIPRAHMPQTSSIQLSV